MMPVFTDALLGDTLHLSAEEFGAYCLLLFATWRNNGRALVEDDRKMARICRVTPKRWRDRLRPVLAAFFDTSDGTWHQKRLEKEWNYVEHYTSEQSRKGRLSALKRWGTSVTDPSIRLKPDGNPHTHTQIHKEDSEASPLLPTDPVKEIFDRGLAILGPTHRSLLGKMRKDHGDEAVLGAIIACETEGPSEPVAFFIGCLKRAPPMRNGHDKDSPVTKLYKGAMRAADKLDRQEEDRRAGGPTVIPLLDRR
jgi:uncharacterized protein YdaU (DUF1376 family)